MHGPVLRSKRPPSNLRGLRSAACGRRKGVRRWQGKLPPIHPGEILREEFLVPLKLTPHAVAAALNAPRTRIAHCARRKARHGRRRAAARKILQDKRRVLDEHSDRFDIETAEDVLAPQIEKIASYETV
ncbi:hypothetical protein [Bradyrhizobium shewense]|uniref:hypothetical protein n=1 Tax=Bradyrhizobium shewense TaxID=1761772 RepID=UPI00322212D3